MTMPQTIKIKRGTTVPGAAALTDGELGLRKGAAGELYAGDGVGVLTLVAPTRQVEIAGAQTITGAKTIDVANIKIPGGVAGQFLSTTDPVTGALAFAPAAAAPIFATDAEMDVVAPSTTTFVNPQNVRSLIGGQLSTLTTSVATGVIPAINSLKTELDLLAIGAIFVGTLDAAGAAVTFTAASGATGPGLPAPADPGNKGWYVITTTAGTIVAGTPANVPAGTYNVGDWVISDGTAWTQLDFSAAAGAVTAGNVSTVAPIPQANVQLALEALITENAAQQAELDALDTTYEPIITGTTAADLWNGAKGWTAATALPLTTAQIAIDAAQDTVIAGKEPALPAGGLATQYLNGLKAWTLFPATEPPIAAGLASQYLNGLKAWVTFPAFEPPIVAATDPAWYYSGDKTWKALPPGSAPPLFDQVSIVGDGAATPYSVAIVDAGTY